jgi:hypothetical protein
MVALMATKETAASLQVAALISASGTGASLGKALTAAEAAARYPKSMCRMRPQRQQQQRQCQQLQHQLQGPTATKAHGQARPLMLLLLLLLLAQWSIRKQV